MKQTVIVFLIAVCLVLSACNSSDNSDNASGLNSAMSQLTNDLAQNSEESTAQSDAELNYENILIDVLGADYFEGRAIMRADDEEIFGEVCAVFQVGTNTKERFVTEEWLALSPNMQVYKYDVALDNWTEFTADSQAIDNEISISIQDCIYALNEVYRDEFSAEYYDTEDMMKKAVYESEDAFNSDSAPVLLIGLNEDVPSGYFADPIDAVYMPVYNFGSKAEVYEHFSHYFTQQFLQGLQWDIENKFLEFDDTLYIVRAGMGYGMFSIDFDNIDYEEIHDNTLIIGRLFHDYIDARIRVEFAEENGSLKIDNDNFLLMYDLYRVSPSLEYVKVPDFSAFVSDNEIATAPDEFTVSQTKADTYSIKYLGDYHDYLPKYATLLRILGYDIIMDGYEGYYSAQKYEGDYTITVNAYMLNDENGVVVEINKMDAVG